ncbi:MAG: hypothetical protein HKN47_17360 [Pirellulaceae bacterium]|nr:hypothetical protein [Pirellulaceae bacterium]
MNVRQTRTLIHAVSAMLVVAAIATLAWGLSDSNSAGADALPSRPTGDSIDETAAQTNQFLVSDVWRTKLRGPLVDPPKPKPRPSIVRTPPKKPTVVAAPIPPIEITLVGTILESGTGIGIFADADGKYDLKTVGETLDLEPTGMLVEGIEATKATVSLQGRQTTLQIKTAAKKGRSGKIKNNRRQR